MSVILLVVMSALTGLAALAGAAACLSAQRGLSLRAESKPHRSPDEEITVEL
ncbi:MAG: hypothetical protein FWD63_09585 [Propionibacteriaceae bacterium]|nr:hypothetical protein [Propionibacteriaceae bacterium]